MQEEVGTEVDRLKAGIRQQRSTAFTTVKTYPETLLLLLHMEM